MATITTALRRVDSFQTMDPLLAVPLCIVENRLAGDLNTLPYPPPPDSPSVESCKYDDRVLSSPTSVVDVIDDLSVGSKKESSKSKKKKKKSKSKLFKVKKKKTGDDENDAVRQEALRRESLRLKHIREEEDADFAQLRAEEESSPKLDMLAHYPLTLMEGVLSIPVPDPIDSDDEGWDEDEEPEPPKEIIADPEGKVIDLGKYEKQVHELRLSKMDLRQFVSIDGNFARMQQELRDGGVITDETLRQRLHILCKPTIEGDDMAECRDIFSTPASRNRGFGSNLPSAYRRMNECTNEIDWRQEIENDPTLPSSNTQECMKTKKNWSDVKLLNLVSNYSQKGRDSYHTEFQDGVEERDMLAYDRLGNLKDGVDLLTYCVHDLVPIVQEHEVFTNLQEELRKIGAVTNEVLKQGLHFYVRDVRLQKEREEAALRAMEEKQIMKEDRDGPLHGARVTKRSQPVVRRKRSSKRGY